MSPNARPPASVGPYQIEGLLGSGGMGTVWLARHGRLGHRVALKQVPVADDAQARRRTLDEGRHAAQLHRHPDVVEVIDVLEDDRHVWLVMEYVPSVTLADLVARHGPLEPGEVARIGARVAAALAAAHEHGILHRDVKPHNVLIRTDGTGVKLGDFGVARRRTDPRLTADGTIIGTLSYLAPEIARGNDPSEASDVFGLGLTLLYAVEGRAPYGEDTSVERLYPRVRNGQLIETDRARRTPEFATLLQRMLHLLDDARVDADFAADRLQEIATAFTAPTLANLAEHPGPKPVTTELPEPVEAATTAPDRPRRRWRRRYTAAAVAGMLIIATAIADPFGWRTPSDSVAGSADPFGTLPPLEGVSLEVDPRAADPCPLLDTVALRAAPSVPGPNLAGCSAAVDDVTVSVEILQAGQTPGFWVTRRPGVVHGPASISFPQAIGQPTSPCATNVTLGAITLYLSARFRRPPPRFTDAAATRLCGIADDAAVTALRALARRGIPNDPNRRSTTGIAAHNACALVDDAPLQQAVPGITTGHSQGYAGWQCSLGARQYNRPHAAVTFQLGTPLTSERKVANLPAIVERGTGWYNQTGCTVWMEYRTRAEWAPSRDERVSVRVELPGDSDACPAATVLAESVAARLPR
ncbi:serine/threonine-protein kinase [Pseudonocardia acaciae]|uniref:serine/threonine-protein kinase n=1 Tax=Pseudonocardia acaciae TaxID=551276 RepID=UPI000686B0A9|nr:serine/threonine-protein kinase [Pseudonocardia acaciae]